MRGLVRELRHLPDRLLHARRRERALDALSAVAATDRILVLCLGNICRSPFAEARLRAAGGLQVRSRGFIGPGRPSPHEAREEAARYGADLDGHVSATVAAEDIEWADIVVVMDGKQARKAARLARGRCPLIVRLGDLDPIRIERRTIPDPFGKGDAAFRASFARMVRCLKPLEGRLLFSGARPEGGA